MTMYKNPQERAENFMACREIGLSIHDMKLRRQFQAMLKDTDEMMVVFTQDELKDVATNFNVAEKTIWTVGELGQTVLKKADSTPRSSSEVKEFLHKLDYLICDDGKSCKPGSKIDVEKHLVEGRCAPIHPRFTADFYKHLQSHLEILKSEFAEKQKEKVRKENEANGIYEEKDAA